MNVFRRLAPVPVSANAQRWPLKVILTVPFMLQLAVAVGLVGYWSHRNGQRAVQDLANQLMQQTGTQVTLELDDYFDSPHELQDSILQAADLGFIDWQDVSTSGDYLWKQIQRFDDVSYVGYALTTGDFAGAGAFLADHGVTIDEISARTGGNNHTFATDAEGQRTEVVKVYTPEDWNPLADEWYTNPWSQQTLSWGSIYIWVDDPDVVTIPLGQPILDLQGEPIGVLNTDLSLACISQFLQEIPLSPSSEIFILEQDGQLVAHSEPSNPFEMIDGQAQRLAAVDSDNLQIQQTAQFLQNRFPDLSAVQDRQALVFESTELADTGAGRQYVQVMPWQNDPGLDWLVVVTVPESDFMAQIHRNARQTIWLCIAAAGITSLFGIVTAYGIAQPIIRLRQASQLVARGQTALELPTSSISELHDLSQSFDQMARQLHHSFDALQQANTQLEERVEQRTTELSETLQALKKTQAQMLQSEKMSALGQLVGGVAHEINNPISFIYGNLNPAKRYIRDLLALLTQYQKTYSTPSTEIQQLIETIEPDFIAEDLEKILSSMEVGAERIRDIVLSLRRFSHLDESSFKLVDIHEGLESTLIMLQHRIRETVRRPAIQIVRDYGELPLVHCAPAELNQVFANILGNAVDALEHKAFDQRQMEEKPALTALEITLRTSLQANQTDRWVEIAIADNGIGMPDTIVERIFDPFFTTKPVGQGTGMGLAICDRIIAQPQGRIECVSNDQQGTAFLITLPLSGAEPEQ